MTRARVEDHVQASIVAWLRAVLPFVEVVAAHNNPRSAIDGARLKRMGLRKGAADLIVFLPRRVIAIEVKRPSNKLAKQRAGTLSDEQIDFGLRLNALGHHFFKAEGIDDCRTAFAALGIETREATQP
jgi:hypothetical protein